MVPYEKYHTVLIVTLILMAVSLVEAFWLQGPLERDQSVYFVIAHEMLKGRSLYSDLWDHKPPAIHLTYALAQFFFGYSMRAVWALGVLAGSLGGIGLWILLRRFAAGRTGTFTGLALWLILFASPNLEGSQPNTEAFISALWIWSAVLLTAPSLNNLQIVKSGLLIGLATLFKPIAAILFLPLIVWIIYQHRHRRGDVVVFLVVLSSVSVLPWLLTLLWFVLSGHSSDLYRAVIEYNRAYAGDISENVMALVSLKRLMPIGIAGLYLPLLICMAGIVFDALVVCRRRALAAASLLLVAYIAVALPGNFYLHYYQFLLPVVVLLCGVQLGQVRRSIAPLLAVAIVASAFCIELATALAPDVFHRAPLSPASINVQARALATQLGPHLKEQEWFYEWGAQPALYFETGISPRHGALHASWLMEGPMAEELSARTLRTLQQYPPAKIVLSQPFLRHSAVNHAILEWISQHYENDPGIKAPTPFIVLTRRKNAA